MASPEDQLQIGEFAELVGLSVPQLRRYDRLQLLTPQGRSAARYDLNLWIGHLGGGAAYLPS